MICKHLNIAKIKNDYLNFIILFKSLKIFMIK